MLSEDSRTLDFIEKVKLRVGDLREGMYVCELDRPWLGTPFPLQGVDIKSDEDIELIKCYCEYVYIDLQRTKTITIDLGSAPVKSFINDTRLVPFHREIEHASVAHEDTSSLYKSFIQDVHLGNSVDIQLAKAAVCECVASVMRNSDAMLFMTQLRRKAEYASKHAFNTCVYSIVLGRQAGMSTLELENLGTCALLHDMGTVKIPDAILNKAGKLSSEEFGIVKRHTFWGREILMSGKHLYPGTAEVAYAHHEAINGSGYPRGLRGPEIDQYSKIVSIADKYDAFTSERPFRTARDHLDTIAVLNKLAAANQLDGPLTAGFVSYLGIYPPGTLVELSSGEVAIVLESNPRHRLKPQILVIRDEMKNPVKKFVDMSRLLTDDRDQPYRITRLRQAGEFDIDLDDYKDAILHALG